MEIFLFVSFITGVISILSPCILPVLPIFIGFNLKKRKSTEIISFVLGLFAIFIIILFATLYSSYICISFTFNWRIFINFMFM